MKQNVFKGVARGAIVATPLHAGADCVISAELELDWLTVLFPGLWAIFSLFFARFRPGVIPRLQLYVSLFVMPFLINLMIRWQIARSWKRWLEWGVESSQMASSHASGPVERRRGR